MGGYVGQMYPEKLKGFTESLLYTGNYALNSDSITSLNVPAYVTEIYGSSFSTKGKLDDVTYADAEQMKTLYIPESVECIGSSNYFMHVTDVYYAGSLNGWESILQFAIVLKATSSVVTKLSTASNGYDNISVTWNSVTGASGYYLYYKNASSSTWSKAIDCGNKSKYTTGNLSDGVKYNIKIVAYFKSGDDVYTAINSKQSSIYTLKKVTKTKVKVSWKNMLPELQNILM